MTEHRSLLRALDSVIEIRTASTGAFEQVQGLWSRCLMASGPRPAHEFLAADSPDPLTEQLIHRLIFEVNDRAIDDLAGRAVMWHAAGVAAPGGDVIALVARSGMGKTTAAIHLCHSGFGYITDETVAVLPDNAILPFPKPLSLVDARMPQGTKLHRSPDDLGLGSPPEGCSLQHVVFLQRDPALAEPFVEPVGLLDAVLELTQHSSHLTRLDRPLQSTCEVLARTSGVHTLHYCEIETATTLVRDLLEVRGPGGGDEWADPMDWQPLDIAPTSPGVDDGRGERRSGRLRRGTVRDGVRHAGEALLLVDRTPLRLGPIGVSLWSALATVRTEAELVDVVVGDHGPHPRAGELVRESLVALVEAGALQR